MVDETILLAPRSATRTVFRMHRSAFEHGSQDILFCDLTPDASVLKTRTHDEKFNACPAQRENLALAECAIDFSLSENFSKARIAYFR